MIPFDVLTTFGIAAFLLSLAPGPDNIFVLTQSALNGARSGTIVVLGLCTGLIVHTLAVALGVAAIISTSALAFTVLKFAGAAYLLYLAYQTLKAPAQRLGEKAPSLGSGALYRRGLIMNLTNPKVAIFFLAFFPQFTDPERGSILMQITLLGGIFMAVTFCVFSGVAVISGALTRWLTASANAQLWMNRIAGFVFIGLAAKIATSER